MLAQALRIWTRLSFKSDIDFLSICIFSLLGLVSMLVLQRLTDNDLQFLMFAG